MTESATGVIEAIASQDSGGADFYGRFMGQGNLGQWNIEAAWRGLSSRRR